MAVYVEGCTCRICKGVRQTDSLCPRHGASLCVTCDLVKPNPELNKARRCIDCQNRLSDLVHQVLSSPEMEPFVNKSVAAGFLQGEI